MTEEIDLNAYITSPYASDLKKQRDAAFESAKNIRKVTESPEEYKIRMTQQNEIQKLGLRKNNEDVLKQRLANLDITNIATKNRIAIENMIKEAEAIKFFAMYNQYNISKNDLTKIDNAIKNAQLQLVLLKKEEELKKHTPHKNIFFDTYTKENNSNDNVLNKLLERQANKKNI